LKKEYTLDNLKEIAKDLSDFARRMRSENIEKFVDTLGNHAANAVKQAYDRTPMDGGRDYVVISENVGVGKRKVVARGSSVAFAEYGAGVHFNSPQVPRPSGVLNIGEYGKGQGKKDTWKMPNGKETHGIPAAQGFVRAREAIETNFERIAREVFK
jgi:hypothetical protein